MSPKPILCLLLALFLFTPAFSFEEENNVLVLTSEDFDKAVDSFEYILIEFYAPWCGHCTKLAPEYEKAALYLKETNSKIKLAKVDATTNKELAERYHVQGFPTLLFFTKGEDVIYSGARNAPGIIGWLKRKTEFTSQRIEKLEELEAAIEKLEFIVIFYGDELDRVFKMYWNVASNNMDIAFFHTSSREITEKYNPTGDAKVSALRSFDQRRVDFEDDFTEANLETFILKNKHPRIMPYSNKVAKLIFGDLNPALLIVKGRGDSTEKAWNVIEQVVDDFRLAGIYTTVCPFDAEECEKVIKYFGVKREDVPAITLFRPASRASKAERYLFQEKVTKENLIKFLEGYKNNELTPLPKSEEIPDKNEDFVKVIVGRSFDDIVRDNEKDVLVFYNDIECPECRELLPTFQGLARLALPIENLILGKVDLDSNYVKGLTFKKCPQVLLYPRHKKDEPITYTGENDLKAMWEFFKDHLTVDFDHSEIKLDDTLDLLKEEAREKEEAAEKSRKKMEELQKSNEARDKAAQAQKPIDTEL